MSFSTLGGSLLVNILTGKEVMTVGEETTEVGEETIRGGHNF